MVENYSEETIKTLNWQEHIRKRPGMYISDTTTRGQQNLEREIVDNAIDEAMTGL